MFEQIQEFNEIQKICISPLLIRIKRNPTLSYQYNSFLIKVKSKYLFKSQLHTDQGNGLKVRRKVLKPTLISYRFCELYMAPQPLYLS